MKWLRYFATRLKTTVLDRTNTIVVVPAFNEQETIVSVIEKIRETGFPFVVIDDGSTDETRKMAISAGARTISLPFNGGIGGAMRCGMRFALEKHFEAIIQCDADGQHNPRYFECLIQAANECGSGIVIGSRFIHSGLNMKVGISKDAGINILSKLVSKNQDWLITDPTSGCRLTKGVLIREVIRCQPNYYLADTIFPLLLAKILGHKVSEVSVEISERAGGFPSASYLNSIGYFVKILFESQSLAGVYRRVSVGVSNEKI